MISSSDILKAAILVVDDQAADVAVLEQLLRLAGYQSVCSTSNPHEVVQLHRKNRYALILLDLQMPGLDGFQVMDGLKELESNRYLPVLAISAQPGDKLRALKAGADFVSKPFDLPEVLARIHNLIEVRLLHQEAELRTGRAEGRFIEAQKMDVIGHLAAGVAHDFNNMLAVIMGRNDLMAPNVCDNRQMREHNNQIRLASEHAAGLTRQLLVFSRKQTVQPVVLDLNDQVQDLDKILRLLVDASIEMTFVPGKQIGRILADSGHIGQILMNLAVNARDAMPHGGKFSIAIKNVSLDKNYARTHAGIIPGEYVMLTACDTGIGMTDDTKAHLFETFFTTKPLGMGTGLGLATCQTIVQQSGGYIEVDSKVGTGTTFKIYFPRVEQPLDVKAGSIQTAPVPRGTETLLIAEDEPSVRHLARDVLQAQGYQVLSASNGQDALRVAREHKGSRIRLVVSDVIMPLMGGKAMAEWLKTAYPDLPILFTSGYTDDAITQQGELPPGTAFLPKPYTPATLGCKVRSMLDHESDPSLFQKGAMRA